jgi:hypothetical protein
MPCATPPFAGQRRGLAVHVIRLGRFHSRGNGDGTEEETARRRGPTISRLLVVMLGISLNLRKQHKNVGQQYVDCW